MLEARTSGPVADICECCINRLLLDAAADGTAAGESRSAQSCHYGVPHHCASGYFNFQIFSWTATGLSVNIGSGAAGVTVRRQNFRQRPVV